MVAGVDGFMVVVAGHKPRPRPSLEGSVCTVRVYGRCLNFLTVGL